LASVARAAGVSTASVSLVLGGRHRDYGISQSTVEKQVMRATVHLSLRFGSG